MNNKILVFTFLLISCIFFIRSTEIPTGDEPSNIAGAYAIVEGDKANIEHIKKIKISDKLGVGGVEHCLVVNEKVCILSHEIGVPIIFSIPLFFSKVVGADIYSLEFIRAYVKYLRIFGILLSGIVLHYLLKHFDRSSKPIKSKFIVLTPFLVFPLLAYTSTLTSDLYALLVSAIMFIFIAKEPYIKYPLIFNIFPFIVLLINTRIGILSGMILFLVFIKSTTNEFNIRKIYIGLFYGFIGLLLFFWVNIFFYGSLFGLLTMSSTMVGFNLNKNVYAFVRYLIDHREGLFVVFPLAIYIYSYAFVLSFYKNTSSILMLLVSASYILVLASAPDASGIHLSGRYILPLCIVSIIYFANNYHLLISHNLWILLPLFTLSCISTFNVINSDFFGFSGLIYGNTSYLLPRLYCPSSLLECSYGNLIYILIIYVLFCISYFHYKFKQQLPL